MGRGPTRDDGRADIEDAALAHLKLRSEKHHAHGHAQEYAPHGSVEEEKRVVGAGAEQVAGLGAELIAHGLEHKADEDEYPQPVGSSETGRVEERKRCEESSAKHYQGRERQFPLMAQRRDHPAHVGCVVADAEQIGLPSLHEEHKHEDGSEHRYEQPPIFL